MYALQNLTCLAVVCLAVIPFFLILAVRFMQFTKMQLLALAGAFIVAGVIIAAMVNNLGGAVPCMFPALFFGVLCLIKHSRDLKHAQRVMTAREQIHALPTHGAEDALALALEPSDDHRNKLRLPKAMQSRQSMDDRSAES